MPTRWLRKGLEVWYTALIETLWPKRRILEMYANFAEFGDGVYGAQAASRSFFRKDAARLSAAEAARLAAVLPSPKRYNDSVQLGISDSSDDRGSTLDLSSYSNRILSCVEVREVTLIFRP